MSAAPVTSRPGPDPDISVVVIFLDEAELLAEAIASVFAQTFDRWELLLVDDGSTDASTAIARSWAATHPERVRYLEHPGHGRRGMSAARNLGVTQARGRWVAYLDADDTWLPEKLERQWELMADHPPARVVYGPLIRWRSWQPDPGPGQGSGAPAGDDLYGIEAEGRRLATDRLYQPPEIVALFLEHKDLVPSGALFDRTLFLEVGGAEESFTGNYEDAVVFLKMGLRAPMYLAPNSWYRYRQRPGHGRSQAESAATRLRFLNWAEQYLAAQQVGDPGLRRAIRRGRRQVRRPRWHRGLARLRRLGRRWAPPGGPWSQRWAS